MYLNIKQYFPNFGPCPSTMYLDKNILPKFSKITVKHKFWICLLKMAETFIFKTAISEDLLHFHMEWFYFQKIVEP